MLTSIEPIRLLSNNDQCTKSIQYEISDRADADTKSFCIIKTSPPSEK